MSIDKPAATITAGGAIFSRLAALGVDYVFANSGTDFPPIIEGLAEAKAKDIPLPQPIVIPHEHAAMGMAHGYFLITGVAQAVMLHTNVGLANGATGAINAACEQIPMYLMSGRTPVTESDRFGARTVPIGWGQEMRDQTALVREASKWDYELKFPDQITMLLDRAAAIANSTPKGPVYLSLPREVLCEEISADNLAQAPAISPVTLAPNPADVERAAELLAKAKHPLIIAQRGVGDKIAFDKFAEWATQWSLPICSWWSTHLAISTEHPCHIGPDPAGHIEAADVILVLNALAPWWPDKHKPDPSASIIHMGPDPLFSRFPVRSFRSDLSIAGETNLCVMALAEAMKNQLRDEQLLRQRGSETAAKSATYKAMVAQQAMAKNAAGITKSWVSKCLGEVLRGKKSSVFSELGTTLGAVERTEFKSWFQEPHSGGLGWSFPAALGAKLADRDRVCIATLGDGSYMFANPTACHQISEALDLPILIVILNNHQWGAVRASVAAMYPDGHAARANEMPLTSLEPIPDFCLTAQASRAWTRDVSDANDVVTALQDALAVVETEKRQALLNIHIIE
jgi:acetolactate synthase-1/2/3 large subunit